VADVSGEHAATRVKPPPVNGWEKVGTIAAIVAALAGVATFILSRRALTHSKKTVLYERLRDARELVGSMLLSGNNIRWDQCNEAGAQLRGVLAAIELPLPETAKLASVEWNLDAYNEKGFQEYVSRAQRELQEATGTLG
jgi:hypothetical protein